MTWKKNFVDYRAIPKQRYDGYTFDSKLEAALYIHMKLLVEGGELEFLQPKQHIFLTEARIEMIPDFQAFDLKLQQQVWYEAKGFETDVWFLKKKLWRVYGPGRLRIFKGNAKSIKMVEEIIPRP